jgi:signal transduction histidine kinase
MARQHATAKAAVDSGTTVDTRLHGRWQISLRGAWLVVAALTLGLFAAGVPARYDQLLRIAAEYRPALLELGLSVDFYAVYFTTLDLIIVLAHLVIAVVIFWRKPDDWMALFVSFTLVVAPLSFINALGTVTAQPTSQALVAVVNYLALVASMSLLYLFPDGRFVPRWTRPLAALWAGLNLPAIFLPEAPISFPTWPLLLQALLLAGWSATGVYAQLYRYLRVSGVAQRQQTRWAVLGLTAVVLGPIGHYLPFITLPSLSQPSLPSLFYQLAGPTVFTLSLLYRLISVTVFTFSLLLFPLSFAVAILRYRLWDIHIFINRALVYGGLTGIVVGLYVIVVGALGTLFQAGGNLFLSILATGLIAILFQPLRQRLQRGVNRLMYGEREDPYAVLSRLGQRLKATLAPAAVLPTIVETVAQALKLPYAAITLKTADGFKIAAEYLTDPPSPDVSRQERGEPRERGASHGSGVEGEALPLVYQHETVGQLLLAPRTPGEAFSAADRRLLEDIAHQAGVAAHAVRLTADLQRSRERIVTAREEERRRLRRDLHDGLGPALAAQTLKVGSARALLGRNPAAADALLGELEHDIEAALADIRRLVYDLRPPALDELGLVGAIRESAATVEATSRRSPERGEGSRSRSSDGLRIVVDAPEGLPPLPAAVEVAAYRIVQEALTNIVRHAQARTCRIRLSLDDLGGRKARSVPHLQLEITDDGIGLPAERRVGVGLASMRERATELGGSCVIEGAPAGGTRVVARLPISKA